eukprot:COSAG01_NODE_10293_length_2199_cov_1.475714_1_plen_173_part_00
MLLHLSLLLQLQLLQLRLRLVLLHLQLLVIPLLLRVLQQLQLLCSLLVLLPLLPLLLLLLSLLLSLLLLRQQKLLLLQRYHWVGVVTQQRRSGHGCDLALAQLLGHSQWSNHHRRLRCRRWLQHWRLLWRRRHPSRPTPLDGLALGFELQGVRLPAGNIGHNMRESRARVFT